MVQILRALAKSTIKAFERLDLEDRIQGVREGAWTLDTIKGELDVEVSLGLEKWLEDI